jgi:CheY-like chemotaxis protein
VSEINSAGNRAAGLTRQLLTFSRKQVLAPQVLDLNDVVPGIEKMLGRLIGEDIEMTLSLAPRPLQIKADQGQLEQIIMNLVVNARDALPAGGRISIETAVVELDETYAAVHSEVNAGRYAALTVSDNGTGMSPEVLSRVFEPFFTTKEQGRGTGLGLATVYGIVRQSGGHIQVYSEPGLGTSFKVYLPIVRTEAPPAEAEPSQPLPQGAGETILLVEDEPAVRGLVRDILEMGGYRVLTASDGENALELSRIHPEAIDVVLTDVVMPGCSGRQLAEQLVQLRPDVKVLYMSGYTDDAVLRNGVLEEGAAFLQKPFTPSALLRKIRGILK